MVSVSDAGEAARRILADDPDLSKPENAALRESVFAKEAVINTASTI